MSGGLDVLEKLCLKEEADELGVKLISDYRQCTHLDIFFRDEKNDFEFGKVSFEEGINNCISWARLFEVLKIEPQNLRSVFHRKTARFEHLFPYNFSWFGLNSETHYMTEIEIPDEILTYDELGYFEFSDKEAIKILSFVLKKEIDVYKFMKGVFVYEFRVYPDGRVIEISHF